MKIHELELTSTKDRKRVGRGIGSGYGKTAGRGTKGQNARTGGGVRIGFAGGQNPLAKQLPKKRGFKALNHTEFQPVNLTVLNGFKDGAVVDNAALAKIGAVKYSDRLVKVLASGSIDKKLTVKTAAASAAAIAAIEKAGGTYTATPLPVVHSKKATRPVTDEKPAKAPKAAAKPKAAVETEAAEA